MKILSFDIGGTKIAYALADENGNLLSEVIKEATPREAERVKALLKRIIAEHEPEIDAVAVSTAGTVDKLNRRICGSVGNMPKGYEKIVFAELSAKPVFVENDANCAVWAEYKAGVAKGTENVILLTLGTGVGVGIVLGGRLLKGKSGSAGEVHFKVNDGNKRRCGCGNYDCLEIYMSGKALNLDAKEAYRDESATSYDVIEGLKQGDERAVTAFSNWQNHVEDGVILFADIFDPEMIVLGGSMAGFINYEKVEKEANERIVTAPFVLREAHFKNDAGIVGAALLCADITAV